ncbi:hypothetical protein JXA84_07895 [candidate division WOR-3 bacterium]|nr:hypothetical protein [candidate division WOR-3 bacterium]
MAKNFSKYGVWGVDKTAFTSSSSSPLWTFLLSCCYSAFGVKEILPFVLNLIFSIIFLFAVDMILKKNRTDMSFRILVLLSIVFFSPLYALVFTGLEHVLHILLVSILLFVSKEVIVENKSVLKIIPIAFFAIATRYESLFLVFVIIIFLFLKKRWVSALSFLIISSLPVIAYGLISVSKGWNFFPNPVFMKGNFSGLVFGELSKLFNRFLEQSAITPDLIVLILSALLLSIFLTKKSFMKTHFCLQFL